VEQAAFPVGDINWLPARKTEWAAQAATEHTALQNKLNTPITGVKTISSMPSEFRLEQNYPNPFNPNTVISYQLSAVSNVSLKVYDILGREIRTLVDGIQKAGEHTINFNASSLSSGVYFYRLTAGQLVSQRTMVLIK
jgi:hypothetical protein